MSALGYIAGGLMQGLGSGMAEKAKMDWMQRRELALETARHGNDMTKQERQFTLQDQNNANQVQRQSNAKIGEMGVAAGIRAGEQQTDFDNTLKLKQVDFENNASLARLQGAIGQANARDRAQFEHDLGSGEFDYYEGGDGFYWKANKRGDDPVKTTIPVMQRQSGGGGNQGIPPRSNSQSPTYTMAQAKQTAQQRGVSIEEVHRVMREKGFRLTN